MGGKNALIVDSDADLDVAVLEGVVSAFHFQGQKCSAASRVIVLEGAYDEFLTRFVDAARSVVIGPPDDPASRMGPVITAEARKTIEAYIEQGKREGRPVLVTEPPAGGWPDGGFYVGPHIFADVAPDAVIAQEEIFGPVVAVMKARDMDEALAIANGTQYALTGGLISRSPATIARVRREFLVGNLYINRGTTGALVERQAFGGFKMSGIGSKAGGPDYLAQFMGSGSPVTGEAAAPAEGEVRQRTDSASGEAESSERPDAVIGRAAAAAGLMKRMSAVRARRRPRARRAARAPERTRAPGSPARRGCAGRGRRGPMGRPRGRPGRRRPRPHRRAGPRDRRRAAHGAPAGRAEPLLLPAARTRAGARIVATATHQCVHDGGGGPRRRRPGRPEARQPDGGEQRPISCDS